MERRVRIGSTQDLQPQRFSADAVGSGVLALADYVNAWLAFLHYWWASMQLQRKRAPDDERSCGESACVNCRLAVRTRSWL